MPFGLHPAYLLILLAIVLIIFGPGKLPELGGAVGRGIREFQKASKDITDEVKSAVQEKETPATTATTASATEPAKAETEKKS
jgi:TatA/E family protein of Tat protein translocase